VRKGRHGGVGVGFLSKALGVLYHLLGNRDAVACNDETRYEFEEEKEKCIQAKAPTKAINMLPHTTAMQASTRLRPCKSW